METTANDSSSNFFPVTPFEAATWQLRNLADGRERCQVALPALQRGAVWRPKQVEALWDSLIRGFPIGSFLLAPYDKRRGSRHPRYGSALDDADYHLLDGQQRWNAITLGFVDIWKSHSEFRDLDALWVDLAPPGGLTDGREFVFRVVTHSHPWGYRRDDPNSRLSAQDRREALAAYEKAYGETYGSVGTGSDIRFRPGKLPLIYAWPWDAIAPVPFAFIADAVKASALDKEVWMTVRQSMECLSYWSATHLPNRNSSCPNSWKDAVLQHLAAPTLPMEQHMEQLAQGVRRNLGIPGTSHSYCIPVLKLPPESPETLHRGDRKEQPDSLETLFIRVNSEGTRLEGEELNYSILKSIYPQAEKLVEKLSTRLMPPARLVTFVSRLVLVNSDEAAKTPPPEPNVARFRRLVHGHDQPFAAGMRRYIGLNESDDQTGDKSYAATLLKHAKDLLTRSANTGPSYGLPSVLVTDLARRSQDAFFVLLVWLDRMLSTGQSLENIDDADKRRIVGVITTLGWFALKPDKCLETLWKCLTTCDPQNFFAPGILRKCSDNSKLADFPQNL